MHNTPSAARWPLIVAAALFVALALSVVLGVITGIDKAVYAAIQPLGSRTGDLIASAVTLLGRTDIAVGIAIVTVVVLLIRGRLLPAIAAAAILAVLALDGVLKNLIGQHRPPAGSGHELHLLPAFLPKVSETLSFPSSHSALAAFLAVTIGHAAPRLRPIVWALTFAVVLSRLYLDKHWASDVVGGLLLGIVVGELAWLITAAFEQSVRTKHASRSTDPGSSS